MAVFYIEYCIFAIHLLERQNAMKNITLSVPDKDFPFFIKLVKNLDFVQIKEAKKGGFKKRKIPE